jgi:hypothetical protein
MLFSKTVPEVTLQTTLSFYSVLGKGYIKQEIVTSLFTGSQPVMFYLRENLKDKFCSNNARTENDPKEWSPILTAKHRRVVNKVFIRH